MKPFFSIISITTNNHSAESIAVGLIMVSDKVYFNYSLDKLNWVKNLNQGENIFHLAHSSLKKIENIIAKHNSENLKNDLFSREYFSYLNQYSGGVFSFSKPVMLPIELDEDTFKTYYEKMIGVSFQSNRILKV